MTTSTIAVWSFLISTTLVGASVFEPTLFDKRDGLETHFPPDVSLERDEDVPTGHLRCFGHQSDSSGSISVISKPQSAESFFDIVKNGKPVMLNETSIADAEIANLNDQDLTSKFGSELIHYVPIRRHRPEDFVLLDSLASFLSSYRKRDEYLASTMPHSMRYLFPLPNHLKCGPFASRLLEAEIWMAWGGTGSLLHYHGDHQLHCMVDGRKDFIFIEGKYKEDFRCKETRPHSGEGVSTVDMDSINMFSDQRLSTIPWNHVTATQGQCVFIPAGYLHHVRSYGRALAFKIHFAPLSDTSRSPEAFSDCDQLDTSAAKTLADFNFVWTMKYGFEQLSDEKLTEESLAAILKVLARGNSELSREEFVAFFNRAMEKGAEYKDEFPSGNKLFNFLDKEGNGALKFDKLEVIMSRLKQAAKVLNKIHIPRHTEL